ncbi:MAG: hypothetical protein IKV59_05205 [Lachnospiraceae bacterium]|nr:hypothetical protein [Lachnospiraceae bacterium]
MYEMFCYRKHINPTICMALFFLGILGGILLVQRQDAAVFAGIFSEYFLNQYASLKIDYEKLLEYIGGYRSGQYALFVCCGALNMAPCLLGILVCLLGISWGTMISISVIRLGIKGVLLCVAGIVPQVLFYFAAFGWIFLWVWKRGSNRKKYLFLAAVGFFFLIFGIASEVYINPLILQQLLRKM